MPIHAKNVLIWLKCFTFKDLRPINNAGTTYLNHNKKKEDYSNLIKTIFWKDYLGDNPDLPTMLCSKCRKNLFLHFEQSMVVNYYQKIFLVIIN